MNPLLCLRVRDLEEAVYEFHIKVLFSVVALPHGPRTPPKIFYRKNSISVVYYLVHMLNNAKTVYIYGYFGSGVSFIVCIGDRGA